jgi:hypothetical protein
MGPLDRKAVIQFTGGNYEDSPLGGPIFDAFLENVIKALGDDWPHLTVDTKGLASLVAKMWGALANEQEQEDSQAEREKAEAAGIQWPAMFTDEEIDDLFGQIQKMRQEHMMATGPSSASARMPDL